MHDSKALAPAAAVAEEAASKQLLSKVCAPSSTVSGIISISYRSFPRPHQSDQHSRFLHRTPTYSWRKCWPYDIWPSPVHRLRQLQYKHLRECTLRKWITAHMDNWRDVGIVANLFKRRRWQEEVNINRITRKRHLNMAYGIPNTTENDWMPSSVCDISRGETARRRTPEDGDAAVTERRWVQLSRSTYYLRV